MNNYNQIDKESFSSGNYFYITANEEPMVYCGYYEVVDPQVGTVVSALPAGYEKVNYNGSMYYEFNGVLFSKVSRGYQVVGYLD